MFLKRCIYMNFSDIKLKSYRKIHTVNNNYLFEIFLKFIYPQIYHI